MLKTQICVTRPLLCVKMTRKVCVSLWTVVSGDVVLFVTQSLFCDHILSWPFLEVIFRRHTKLRPRLQARFFEAPSRLVTTWHICYLILPNLTFMGLCIVIYFYSKTNKMHNFSNFLNITLQVSDGLSVHNQESKTVHTASGIFRTG